jgi:Fic family protein
VKIPSCPPDYLKVIQDWGRLDPGGFQKSIALGIGTLPGGKYRHWDNLVHLQPPEDLTHERWWALTKVARSAGMRRIPLLDKKARPFQFAIPDPVLEMTHAIDSNASGRIEISEEVTTPGTRDRYLVSSLIEEAITSSQLEGAATTTQVAKDMLRSGRRPKDKGERMILNNYRGMKLICELKEKPFTPQRIIQLQKQLTAGTLSDESAAGRLRRDDEKIVVWDQRDQTLIHEPPGARQLPKRLEALCAFANQNTPDFFIHPVMRAIILHFWLAYDHPFVDGNGRTARAVFYWSMLSQGYWLSEFFSISSILKRAPAKYMRSFLYTETDDNDVTYFILYNLKVIARAIDALHLYLEAKTEEARRTMALIRKSSDFNHRQIALLSHALRHPGAEYTIQSHRNSHNVVYETARSDLFDLAGRRFLEKRKLKNAYYFAAPDDLAGRLTGKSPRRFGKSRR